MFIRRSFSASRERPKDAYLGGLKDELQENLTQRKNKFQRNLMMSPGITSLFLKNKEACWKPHAGETAESISSAFPKSQKNQDATMDHFFAISPQTISYTETIYDMVRKIYGRPSDDLMKDLNVNLAKWRMFMNTTLRAAVHLGRDM